MKKIANAAILFSLLLAVCTFVATPAVAQSVFLTFEKSIDPKAPEGRSRWQGRVAGDEHGRLTTYLLGAPEVVELEGGAQVWAVDFIFRVRHKGNQTSDLRISGFLDLRTGEVFMEGVGVSGPYKGYQVHEQGQLIDADTLTFKGLIELVPIG